MPHGYLLLDPSGGTRCSSQFLGARPVKPGQLIRAPAGGGVVRIPLSPSTGQLRPRGTPRSPGSSTAPVTCPLPPPRSPALSLFWPLSSEHPSRDGPHDAGGRVKNQNQAHDARAPPGDGPDGDTPGVLLACCGGGSERSGARAAQRLRRGHGSARASERSLRVVVLSRGRKFRAVTEVCVCDRHATRCPSVQSGTVLLLFFFCLDTP
jgi:hypothetical protein